MTGMIKRLALCQLPDVCWECSDKIDLSNWKLILPPSTPAPSDSVFRVFSQITQKTSKCNIFITIKVR